VSHEELVLECPVCRCRMQVPTRRGTVAFTCRSGHRFVHEFGSRGASWPKRHPKLALTMVAVGVLLIVLAVRQWPWHGFPIRST